MDRAAVEQRVKTLCAAGDVDAATTVAIESYGPELLGFLVTLVGDAADAGEVFADLSVRVWKSLGTFRWESSLRTWTYVLARRAYYAFRQARVQRGEQVRLSDVPELDAMIARVRTTTLASLREQRQTRAQRLRAKLSPDEQALLTLRIDRELEWRDIAAVMAEDDTLGDDDALAREVVALRKKFERLKAKLRKLAAAEPE